MSKTMTISIGDSPLGFPSKFDLKNVAIYNSYLEVIGECTKAY